MKRHAPISCALCLVLVAGGCSTVRPLANGGHDLVENAGWPWWVRGTAGIGAVAGLLLAMPVSVVLFPEYVIWGQPTSITTSQGYGLRDDIPTAAMRTAEGAPASADGSGPEDESERGDIRLPLALAPLDYGGGMGAGILGAPFRGLARLFMDAPPPPPGTLREIPNGVVLGFEAEESVPRGAGE